MSKKEKILNILLMRKFATNVRNVFEFLASIVIPLILLSPILNAQVSSIHQGDVVRLTAPKYSIRSVVGTLVDLKHDTLNFRMGERTVAVPLQQITKLEVARGKKRQTGSGSYSFRQRAGAPPEMNGNKNRLTITISSKRRTL